MQHKDALYGAFELPEMIRRLMQTPEFQRLKDISMDTFPRYVVPYGVTSRFEHCLGVVRLMLDVIASNQYSLTEFQKQWLLAGALFHDVGNPALSHLTEPFLFNRTGKNGESFLDEMLAGSASMGIMESFGLLSSEVVAMVTGNAKPLSDVLHGSMDVDNLDNVLRYQFISSGARSFDPHLIASSYRFRRGRWELSMQCLEEVRKWQEARRSVYATIYGRTHMALTSMAYRAVDLVFQEDDFPMEFFRFTDTEAFEFLQIHDKARHLIEAVLAGRYYEEVVSVETTQPKNDLRHFADSVWNARGVLAECVAADAEIPSWAVCAYCGKGRDVRRVHLPFVDATEGEYWDESEADPIYRLKVYVHPEFADNVALRAYARQFTV